MISGNNHVETTERPAGTGARARHQPRWLLPLLILIAPSVYFFYRFPPLWRDSDGFFQLASGINELTLIHWPPLYCLSARVLLLLGALFEWALHGSLGHFHWSFGKPTFTDGGIYALLIAQHLVLVVSLLITVTALTGRFWLRVILAVGFALNPSLYAFAHCVGTEALSNALTLLTFAAAVRVFREPSRSAYGGYALALGGAVLTRPINAALAGLLPAALGLAAIVLWLKNRAAAGGDRLPARLFRQAAVSVVVAAAVVAASGALVRGLCLIKHLPYRSRVGYTFMWRLNYLVGLTPGQRAEVVHRVEAKLHDPITVAALAATVRELDQNPSWDTHTLYYGISDALRQNGISRQRTLNFETDQRLNRLARAVLFPPDRALCAAVVHDFLAGFQYTLANVSGVPFRATDWLQARLDLPSFEPIRPLITFRGTGTAGVHEDQWRAAPYLQLWAGIPFWVFGLADLLLGLFVCWQDLCWQHKGTRLSPGYLVIATVGTGAILYFINCWLTFLGDRFMLPVEILFWCGISLALAVLAESRVLPRAGPALSRDNAGPP